MASDDDEPSKKRSARICCFNLLGLTSLAAFVCGIYSYAYCDFVGREVTLNPAREYDDSYAGLEQACEDLGFSNDEGLNRACTTLLQPHAIGFYYWQATVPVEQKVCFTYTQLTPYGYVTPEIDRKFNASRWLSVVGYIFGGMGWFTIAFANCCRIDQQRLQGTSCNFLMASLFTGLSLLMFKSSACDKGFFAPYFVRPDYLDEDEDAAESPQFDDVVSDVSCSLSTGSSLAIAATVLYFVSACMVPAATVPGYASQERYAETYKEDEMALEEGEPEAQTQAQVA